MTPELLGRFKNLFAGYAKAYGLFYPHDAAKQMGKTKLEGDCPVIKKEHTDEQWVAHLEGRNALSIIPLLENNCCSYAALDIDDYTIDAKLVANAIATHNLPAIPCRSKSGGWHLYFFFAVPVPAQVVRQKLQHIAANLGRAEAEIFPKQDSVLWAEGEVGNWLGLPYFDCEPGPTMRYALNANGEAITFESFLTIAESLKVTLDQFLAIQFKAATGGDFADGAVCLQLIKAKGVGPGMRNDFLFNAAIYLKKKFPESWGEELQKLNSSLDEPIDTKELLAMEKSVGKKDYNYRCHLPMLEKVCDSATCRKREFGVGSDGFVFGLAGLTKVLTEPVTWYLDVGDGKRLRCLTEDLLDQGKFRRTCMEFLDVLPPLVSREMWDARMRALLTKVSIIPVPKESTATGILEEAIREFLEGRQAVEKEDMRTGRPWEENGTSYARMSDMTQYVQRKNLGKYTSRDMTNAVRDMGGFATKIYTKFGTVNCWGIKCRPEWLEQHKARKEGKDETVSTY